MHMVHVFLEREARVRDATDMLEKSLQKLHKTTTQHNKKHKFLLEKPHSLVSHSKYEAGNDNHGI